MLIVLFFVFLFLFRMLGNSMWLILGFTAFGALHFLLYASCLCVQYFFFIFGIWGSHQNTDDGIVVARLLWFMVHFAIVYCVYCFGWSFLSIDPLCACALPICVLFFPVCQCPGLFSIVYISCCVLRRNKTFMLNFPGKQHVHPHASIIYVPNHGCDEPVEFPQSLVHLNRPHQCGIRWCEGIHIIRWLLRLRFLCGVFVFVWVKVKPFNYIYISFFIFLFLRHATPLLSAHLAPL